MRLSPKTPAVRLIVGALSGAVAVAAAVAVVAAHPAHPARQPRASRMPFSVGEKLTYSANINFLRVGAATMTVEGIEPIRGHITYHTVFRVKGRMLFFKVDDHYESWFDTTSLSSLRYQQNIDEGSYEADRTYEFFPDRQTYLETGKPEQPSVPDPLDDGSFIYFVRSLPLDVGQTYEFNRYFVPGKNPVRLTVLRKEHVKVAAGEFDAIVVQPEIKAGGIFSDKARAEIWFADDSTRMMLRMRSGLPFGTLFLELKKIERTEHTP